MTFIGSELGEGATCFSGEGEFGRGDLVGRVDVCVCYGCIVGGVCTMLVCNCVEFAEICCCVTVSGYGFMLVV